MQAAITKELTTIGAVIARKIRSPKETGWNPKAIAFSTSASVHPPSQPVAMTIEDGLLLFRQCQRVGMFLLATQIYLSCLGWVLLIARLNLTGSNTVGTICLSDCSAASVAILRHRWTLLGLGLRIVRSLITGIKLLTPNSVQHRTTCSYPLPLGNAVIKLRDTYNSVLRSTHSIILAELSSIAAIQVFSSPSRAIKWTLGLSRHTRNN